MITLPGYFPFFFTCMSLPSSLESCPLAQVVYSMLPEVGSLIGLLGKSTSSSFLLGFSFACWVRTEVWVGPSTSLDWAHGFYFVLKSYPSHNNIWYLFLFVISILIFIYSYIWIFFFFLGVCVSYICKFNSSIVFFFFTFILLGLSISTCSLRKLFHFCSLFYFVLDFLICLWEL